MLFGLVSHADVTFDANSGIIEDGPLRLELLHFAPGWSATFQGRKGRVDPASLHQSDVWNGYFPVAGGIFNVSRKNSKTAEDVEIVLELKSEQPIPTQELSLTVILPFASYRGRNIAIDGQIISLPSLLHGGSLLRKTAKIVEIPQHDKVCCLKGNWTLSVQQLASGDGYFHIRLLFPLESQSGLNHRLSLAISHRPFRQGESLRPLPAPERCYKADGIYSEIEWSPIPVLPGSALDLSQLLDAPAGKHGRVVAKGEFFEFEHLPGIRQRFWGTNICSEAAMPPHYEADLLADTLAACGYNAVRLHHFDMRLSAPGSDRITDEAAFDRMCYLMNALRRRGIYYTIDLFTQRRLTVDMSKKKSREIIAGTKLLLPVNTEFDANMRNFARDLFNRVNPYSGLALKDDPALLPFNIINENPLPNNASFFPQYLKPYEAELLQKHPGVSNLSAVEKRRELGWFMLNRQIEYYQSMRNFLHSIGVCQATSDLSMGNHVQLIMPRSALGFVDNHSYHALYEFDAHGRVAQAQHSPGVAGFGYPLLTGATRILGKPFVVGEAQICAVNPFRMQYAPVVAGFGLLQGWSGIMHYAFSHNAGRIKEAQGVDRLNYGSDPLMLMGDRFGALAFLRTETVPKVPEVPYVVTPDYIKQIASPTGGRTYPAAYWRLGTTVRIGSLLVDHPVPELAKSPFIVVPAEMAVPEWLQGRRVVLDSTDLSAVLRRLIPDNNGLIKYEVGRMFCLSADGAEALLVEGAEKKEVKGNYLELKSDGVPAVLTAAALDGMKLSESKRILLLYLTDLKNSGTVIHNESVLVDRGSLPLLVQCSSAKVTISASKIGKIQVYALKYNGERCFEIPVKIIENGKHEFTVQSVTAPDVYYAYEIVAEQL